MSSTNAFAGAELVEVGVGTRAVTSGAGIPIQAPRPDRQRLLANNGRDLDHRHR